MPVAGSPSRRWINGRVGALEQIRAFGDSIGVPAAALDDPGAFGRLLSVHGPARYDVVLVDGSGDLAGDIAALEDQANLDRCEPASRSSRSPAGRCSCHLRASRVCTHDLAPIGAIVTKIDETEEPFPAMDPRGRPRPRDRLPVQRARHRAPLPPRVRRALRGRRPDREDRLMSVSSERPSSRGYKGVWARPPSPRTSASISPVRAGGSSQVDLDLGLANLDLTLGPGRRPGWRRPSPGRCPSRTAWSQVRAVSTSCRPRPGARTLQIHGPERRSRLIELFRGLARRYDVVVGDSAAGVGADVGVSRRSPIASCSSPPRQQRSPMRTAHQGARHARRPPRGRHPHAGGARQPRQRRRGGHHWHVTICERFVWAYRTELATPLSSVERCQSEGALRAAQSQGAGERLHGPDLGPAARLPASRRLPWLPEKLLRVISMAVDQRRTVADVVHAMRASGAYAVRTDDQVELGRHCSPSSTTPPPDRRCAAPSPGAPCSWWSRRGSGSPNARARAARGSGPERRRRGRHRGPRRRRPDPRDPQRCSDPTSRPRRRVEAARDPGGER